jgi:hypothetical protein
MRVREVEKASLAGMADDGVNGAQIAAVPVWDEQMVYRRD